MLTLHEIECGLLARGLTPGQVQAAIASARNRLAACRRPQRDTAALARELRLESPYFWETFETPLPDLTEKEA